MTLAHRRLPSSVLLPTFAQDFDGCTILCAERGVTSYTPWTSCGGQWVAQGPSYTGATSGLPPAGKLRIGTRAVIDEPAPGGLTRPLSGGVVGVKMLRLNLVAKYASDGVTQVWRPDGAQTLFAANGVHGTVLQSFTAAAATGIISEFGQIPANLFSQLIGCELYWNILVENTTGTHTVTAALTVNPTPGTQGNTLGAATGIAANSNSVGWVAGSGFIASSALTQATQQDTPGGNAQVASSGKIANDWTVAQTLQVGFSSATIGDTFSLLDLNVGIR